MVRLKPGLDSETRALRIALYIRLLEVEQQDARFEMNPRSTEFQHLVYLLERCLGIGDGRFYYRWEFFGLHSSQLTGEAYACVLPCDKKPVDQAQPEYETEIMGAINTIGAAVEETHGLRLCQWLQILASLAHIWEEKCENVTKQNAHKMLKKQCPNASFLIKPRLVRAAWEVLQQMGLIKTC